MNVFTQKRHTGKLAIAATSILSAVAAHAADVTAPKLVLTAYINGVGGEEVMAGNYDAALTQIKRNRTASSDEYSAKVTNECVTYAATKQLTQAMSACDAALRSAKADRMGTLRVSSGAHVQDGYLAIAYANRAVVQMMAKNPDAAKSDMARAKSLAPDAEFVSKNLVAMESSTSKIAQANVAPAR